MGLDGACVHGNVCMLDCRAPRLRPRPCARVRARAQVDVRALGADWIVASGHKMCGPTGIGFLWGRCAEGLGWGGASHTAAGGGGG